MSEAVATHAAGNAAGNGRHFRVRWDGSINLGTLLHLLVLVSTLTAVYFGVQQRLDAMEGRQNAILQRMVTAEVAAEDSARRNQRIELYLRSRDARYWKVIEDFERAMPAAAAPSTAAPKDRPPETWRRPQ